MSLKEKTKTRALIEIISASSEFGNVPMRHKEDVILRQLAERLPGQLKNQKFTDPHVKVNLLIHAHLSRVKLTAELNKDTELIVLRACRLVQACVDVLSSNGWLSPAIHAMELSQMLTQAMYSNEPYLKQLPHCSAALLERAKAKEVTSVFELLELENDDRSDILQMEGAELADVARFCNHYPSIEVATELENDVVTSNDNLMLAVSLERDNDIDGLAPPVVAPLFPQKRKEEGWWLVIGDSESNALLTIKRYGRVF